MKDCYGLPRQLVEDRLQAFKDGDFGAIYDSYHPEAPFLEQFPQRDDYLAFAQESIVGSCSIERCLIHYEQVDGDEALILLQQLLKTSAGYQESFELAHLSKIDDCWKYLGSERIDRSDFKGRPEDLRPEDFERIPHRVFI